MSKMVSCIIGICYESFQELEKKVSGTAPFRNLKAMLQKKNEQIKDLRRRLSRYDSCSLFTDIDMVSLEYQKYKNYCKKINYAILWGKKLCPY